MDMFGNKISKEFNNSLYKSINNTCVLDLKIEKEKDVTMSKLRSV